MAVNILGSLAMLLLFIIAFNFGAYTLLLKVIARFRKVDHSIDPDYQPSVTILIAAYNEEACLEEKLKNSLTLAYPKNLLDIVVVSDGSTDNTDQIARQFESQNIKLVVNPTNSGKATALNNGMQSISSDIVVLSDANVMYQEDAIRNLVRHFSDSNIGAVSGKVVLVNDGLSYSASEDAYYSVEHNIQQLESNTGNLIGADGAMYAIRRELFRPLQKDTLLDDFVLSMGVIQQGKRLIFDGDALGFEQNLAEIESEYKRKVRIIAGGIQSLQRKTSWPPKGHGLTAIKFLCHKVFRWIIGPLVVTFIALVLLLGLISGNYLLVTFAVAAILAYPIVQIATRLFPSLLQYKLVNLFRYLVTMMTASVVGCYKALVSNQQVSWR